VALRPNAGHGVLILEVSRSQRRTTVGRTPLDEWSARRRDLYLKKHNTHKRQTSMPPVGFEPKNSAGERPQTYVNYYYYYYYYYHNRILHFSTSAGKHSPILRYVISRNRLGGLIYNLKSFLQLNMFQELQIFALLLLLLLLLLMRSRAVCLLIMFQFEARMLDFN
jgi:hypothetical protein